MALREIDAICDYCGTSFQAIPKRSFIGFQKLTCPSCAGAVTYPLTTGYRVIYVIMVAGMAVTFFMTLGTGHPLTPGLTGCAVIVGLVRDRRLRREIAETERNRRLAQGAGATPLKNP